LWGSLLENVQLEDLEGHGSVILRMDLREVRCDDGR
jgi:hypothetical protein